MVYAAKQKQKYEERRYVLQKNDRDYIVSYNRETNKTENFVLSCYHTVIELRRTCVLMLGGGIYIKQVVCCYIKT
jgi:hypothetical protein